MELLAVTCQKMRYAVCVTMPDGKLNFFNNEYSGCPDYRNKYVTINCNKYKINWVK